MNRRVTLGLTAAAVLYGGSSQAQELYKWNDLTNGIIDAPILVNVYWDTSRAQWDADVNAAYASTPGVGIPTFARIEAVTRAWSNSMAPRGVGEYNSTGGSGDAAYQGAIGMFPSIILGDVCPASIAAPPANTQAGHNIVGGGPPSCLLTALDALQYDTSQMIVNYIYPPQVTGGGDQNLCTQASAYHDHSGGIPSTFIPTNANCNNGLSPMIASMTHEMIEAVTDPMPTSGLGYRSLGIYNGQEQEACDLCQGPPFGPSGLNRFTPFMNALLGTQVSNLWSNARNTCYPGYDDQGALHAIVRACGRGANMTFTLAFSDTGTPWDLGPSNTGTKTIFLQAAASSPSNQALWSAGGFLRVPTPDTIGFHGLGYEVENYWYNPFNSLANGPFNGGVPWMQIGVNGFDQDVQLSAGDVITFTLTSPNTGLSTTAKATVGGGNQVSLVVVPPASTPVPGWTIFGDASVATGSLVDDCGAFGTAPVEGDTVTGNTESIAYFTDYTDPLPSPVPVASGPSDELGNVSIPLTTNTAGQMVLDLATPAAAAGPSVNVDVHPRVDWVYFSGNQGTVYGGGFAQPLQGARTTVSLGSGWGSNVVVSTNLTTVTFTAPSVPLNGMATLLVWVDGLSSVPLTVCNHGGTLTQCAEKDLVLTGGALFTGLPTAVSNGDGTFFGTYEHETTGDTRFAVYATEAGATPVRGDFDGDGLLDTALTAGTGWTTIPVAFARPPYYHGTNGHVSTGFTAFTTAAAQAGAKPVTGDFDGDGKTDIALTCGAGWSTVPVAFSNGDGTFRGTNTFVGSFPAWAAESGVTPVTGDFNGDGKADIALIGGGWSFIPIAYSNGDGSFDVVEATVTTGFTAFTTAATQAGARPVAGDFDGDGKADIALTCGTGWNTMPIAFSNGNGTFHATNSWETSGDKGFPTYATQAGAVPMAEDLNGDGKADLVLSGGTGWTTIPVAFSNGDGTFHGTNSGMTQGLSLFPTYASEQNVKVVAR